MTITTKSLAACYGPCKNPEITVKLLIFVGYKFSWISWLTQTMKLNSQQNTHYLFRNTNTHVFNQCKNHIERYNVIPCCTCMN